MIASPHEELRHGIDRLVINDRRVFGWGWVAHRSRTVREISLHLQGDGWERRLPVNAGLSRHDVKESFPALKNAAFSGFVVTGFIPVRTPRRLSLQLTFADGGATDIDVTSQAETRYGRQRQKRMVAWLADAVWRRLKKGDLSGLVRRVKAQNPFTLPTLDDANIVAELTPTLGRGGLSIVFDHNMGGGANHYRRQLIAERVAAGETVLLCTYNLPTLEYRIVVNEPGAEPRELRLSTFVALERILAARPGVELFVNSPVSFDEPLLLAEWLVRMRSQHPGVRLTVTAHDYFAVCPSFVLLDADGRYCGIPDIGECASCLKRHAASYVALSPPSEIGPWRSLWGRCLRAADEIRCFSESTRTHLLRAHPDLPLDRLTVIPHRVDFVPARKPRLDPAAPLAIGVIGEISPQKGAYIVTRLLDRLDREGSDVRVVVIGTLDVAHASERLHITGRYRREELADLVEAHGLNMFLFPSPWPETFSYVVNEMIALDLPIVAFDIGAPGERLRAYPRARLCPDVDADAALDAMRAFHRELAADKATEPAA